MPLSAWVFYLNSKYHHETVRDNYFADMLRYAAGGNVKEPERIPRYWDRVKPKEAEPETVKSGEEILLELLK
jgi:hypothetical protein